ncbi:MAG: Lrp/AsnC ligand binding domain-containing protein [Dehalococcoidales bacterium]|jgi:DNA-binding Lrp family transcriptional regulator|nr:Lrp/AsnC family transcriptional regulator [Dehalococcoidales bacterium]
MKARAYVLVETAVGKTKAVVTSLRKMEGIESVDTVTGPYDVIAVVEADTLNEVGDIITAQIHTIDGISRTVTCLVV